MRNLPQDVKKSDIHRIALWLVDCIFALPRLFRGRLILKADFDLTASVRLSTKKTSTEVDDAGK